MNRVTLRAVTNHVIAALLGGGALFASLTVKPASSAADTAAAPTASADAVPASTATAAAAADPSGKAKAEPPPLPRFDAEPFSEEKSPRPKAEEWKPVQPVALTDPDPLPFGCKAYRLREWVKIRCSNLATSSLALLGGKRDDVFVFIDPPPPAEHSFGAPFSVGAELLFAVRRGDARVFEWSTFGESYEGPGFPSVAFMISESWTPDEKVPTIVVHAP